MTELKLPMGMAELRSALGEILGLGMTQAPHFSVLLSSRQGQAIIVDNRFFGPGTSTLEELIAQVDRGIFLDIESSIYHRVQHTRDSLEAGTSISWQGAVVLRQDALANVRGSAETGFFWKLSWSTDGTFQ